MGRCIDFNKFKLQHDQPSDFVHSSVSKHPIVYAIISTVLGIYTLTILILSGINTKSFLYLTFWSYSTLTFRCVLTAINSWIYVIRRKGSQSSPSGPGSVESRTLEVARMPIAYKIQWVFQNVTTCAAFIVTVVFWSLRYPKKGTVSTTGIQTHGLNSVIALADLLLSRAPVRVYHFIHPFVYFCCYSAFNVIFWAAGGTTGDGDRYIYDDLDYSEKPGEAALLLLLVGFVGVPLMQTLMYGLFRLRQWVCSKCCQHDQDRPANVHTLSVSTVEVPK